MLRRNGRATTLAVVAFSLGENALDETGSSLDGMSDATDFDDVYSY